jgi:hypothetical protein
MLWKIKQLDVMNTDGLPNVVIISRFEISDIQGGTTGSVSYGVQLAPPQGSDFTPYDQITEAQALQWTKDALGPDTVIAMESEVQAIIDTKKIPVPEPKPLPWDPIPVKQPA